MRPHSILAGLVGLAFGLPVSAQSGSPMAMDSLLQQLVGTWHMDGTVRGRPAAYRLDASRVLHGTFVELHMEDVTRSPTYEARVFLGVDSTARRYIVHWLDSFGAAFSIPHALGEARGDTIQFTFAYADGPFRDTFVYDRPTDVWHFHLESTDASGRWTPFADYLVRRR